MSFPLYGNENICESVKNFIRADRIPHAFLIEGDEGTGKSTLALYIAKAAVCEGENKPCNACKQCSMANANSNPDILYISPEDGKKNISVNQIREIRQSAFIKPHSADKKVFIIEDAERMNEQAQNALLKVLEEPPQSVIFILCATSKTMLLTTVCSRCTILSLNVPDFNSAFNAVTKITGADSDTAKAALQMHENNIGLAIKEINKESESEALAVAKEFLGKIFTESEYELLNLLQSVSSNRKTADDFFSSLKMLIAKDMRKNYSLSSRTKVLDGLYLKTDYYTELLSKNINLTLLYSALVSDISAFKHEPA